MVFCTSEYSENLCISVYLLYTFSTDMSTVRIGSFETNKTTLRIWQDVLFYLFSGWWFQPIWKYQSNWIISSNRGENKKDLKPPPSLTSTQRIPSSFFSSVNPIDTIGRLKNCNIIISWRGCNISMIHSFWARKQKSQSIVLIWFPRDFHSRAATKKNSPSWRVGWGSPILLSWSELFWAPWNVIR